jgi:hypothetical protein
MTFLPGEQDFCTKSNKPRSSHRLERSVFCGNSFKSAQDTAQCNTSLSKFEPVLLSVRHSVELIRDCLSCAYKTVQIEIGLSEYGGNKKAVRTDGLLTKHQN